MELIVRLDRSGHLLVEKFYTNRDLLPERRAAIVCSTFEVSLRDVIV